MPCFHPWRMPRKDPHGRVYSDLPDVTVACRQCIGCRIDHAQEWGLRCTHEAKMHECSSFLTLTFSDEQYPASGSVDIRDMQLFQKRLRFERDGERLRFFSCGEYSPRWRAHYHVLAFGLELRDRKFFSRSKTGYNVYTSAELSELWPFGYAYASDLNYETCAYVARYSMKKVNGKRAAEHYWRPHPVTGELVNLRPEFITMSRRPGIGDEWFNRFASDAFPSDFLVLNGSKVPVPDFYLRRLAEREDADKLLTPALRVRLARLVRGRAMAADNTPERLAVREECAERRLSLLARSFERSL